MPRTDHAVSTEDGTCQATVHTPEPEGSWPAVIVYPDAVGARETFRELADRLAGFGYTVFLPDIYYRTPYPPFSAETLFSDPNEWARVIALIDSLGTAQVVADTAAFLRFLSDRPEVSGSAVGTTGYCRGGRMSLIVAGHHPDRIVAAASFHGGDLAAQDDPDSPSLLADRMRAEVLVASAANDEHCPPEQLARLERALSDADVAHTIETYPAAHGFAVADNSTHDPAAEQRHWEALRALYARTLRG